MVNRTRLAVQKSHTYNKSFVHVILCIKSDIKGHWNIQFWPSFPWRSGLRNRTRYRFSSGEGCKLASMPKMSYTAQTRYGGLPAKNRIMVALNIASEWLRPIGYVKKLYFSDELNEVWATLDQVYWPKRGLYHNFHYYIILYFEQGTM